MANELGKQSPFFEHVGLPIAKAFAWILLTILGPFTRKNVKRVPRSGGLLILSNHQADLDPIAVQIACPRTVYFMAKSELFEMKVLGKVIRWFKAFPVKRGEPDRSAIKHAVNLLKAGETVCVFPEGELSESGELLPLKPGVALIVRMANVPVICCRIDGTRRILPYGKLLPRPAFHTVSVKWGEPHQFTRDSETEEIIDWADKQLRLLY